MLKLVIDGKEVDLRPNTTADLSVRGNLFVGGESNQGSFAYNITVDATPNNMGLLQFAHRLHKRKRKALSIEGYWHLSSNIQMPALIKVREADANQYELQIGVGNGVYYANFKDTQLRSLDFGRYNLWGVELYSYGYTNAYYPYTPDVSPFALFPVHNKSFFRALDESVDASLYVSVEWQNMFNSTQFGAGTYGWSVITPFYYMHWVINKLFALTGYQVGRNAFYDDEEMRNWCLFNVTDCAFDNTDGMLQERWSQAAKHLPQMTVGEFISAVEKRFNVRFIFSLLKKEVSIVKFDDVVSVARSFQFRAKKNPSILYEETPTGFKLVETEVKDDEAYNRYNTTYNIGKGNVAIVDSVPNFADLPTPDVSLVDKVYNVANTKTYYRCNAVGGIPVQYAWQVAFNFETELTVGTNPEEIESACTTLPMDRVMWRSEPSWSLDHVPDYIYCPVADMQGGTSNQKMLFLGVEPPDAGLRLLAFRGKNTSQQGEDVDFGSSDVYMDTENTLWPGAQYSLFWKTSRKDDAGNWVESGIYDMFYKNYIEFRQNAQKIKFTAHVETFELAHLDFLQLWRAAQTDCIPDNFTATITDRGVVSADFEAFIL